MNDKLNIIFIVMDALRPKNLGCYGYPRATSPNIDSLAKQGTIFEQGFSSNNATPKSFIATLSSRHILLEGKKNLLLTDKELNLFNSSGGIFLQEILKKEGYKTYCLKDLYGWQKKGFDYFYEFGKIEKNKGIFLKSLKTVHRLRPFFRGVTHYLPKKIADKVKAKYGRSDGKRVTEEAIRIIKESKEKKESFFMWVDYADTHIPYNPKEFTGKFVADKEIKSENFIKKVSKESHDREMMSFWKGAFSRNDTVEDIISRYDSAIFYDDFLIGKILESLKQEELMESTIIFFFSDHGESLGEHGIYFTHHGLYDQSTNFPLIICGKMIPKGKRIKEFIQHEDFVPTILDILKIKHDPLLFDGKSLLPLLNNRGKIRDKVFMEEGDLVKKRAIRTENYKYIEALTKEDALCRYCNRIHGGILELYDLKKDPEEKNNLAKEQREILVKMKIELEKEIKTLKMLNEKRRIKKVLGEVTTKK